MHYFWAVLYTDASKTGWGAQIEQGINTCGIWSKSESTRHINYLELSAVDLALSSLFNNRSDIHIRVMSDNTTAVSYINAMGGGGGGGGVQVIRMQFPYSENLELGHC